MCICNPFELCSRGKGGFMFLKRFLYSNSIHLSLNIFFNLKVNVICLCWTREKMHPFCACAHHNVSCFSQSCITCGASPRVRRTLSGQLCCVALDLTCLAGMSMRKPFSLSSYHCGMYYLHYSFLITRVTQVLLLLILNYSMMGWGFAYISSFDKKSL